jgi:hypothetical protein
MSDIQLGRVKKRSTKSHVQNQVQKTKKHRKKAFYLLSLPITLAVLMYVYPIVKSFASDYIVLAQQETIITPSEQASSINLENGISTNDPEDVSLNSQFISLDKRAYILDQYLKANNSPLYGYGQTFVNACDKYGAPKDCMVVVAIARNESNLCKYYGSAEMHNCWGFGGGGSYRMNFGSFEESIDRVTNVLVNQYGIQYMNNPSLMERTFCGDEPGCTGWGNKIKHFMNDINAYGDSLGLGSLYSLR